MSFEICFILVANEFSNPLYKLLYVKICSRYFVKRRIKEFDLVLAVFSNVNRQLWGFSYNQKSFPFNL